MHGARRRAKRPMGELGPRRPKRQRRSVEAQQASGRKAARPRARLKGEANPPTGPAGTWPGARAAGAGRGTAAPGGGCPPTTGRWLSPSCIDARAGWCSFHASRFDRHQQARQQPQQQQEDRGRAPESMVRCGWAVGPHRQSAVCAWALSLAQGLPRAKERKRVKVGDMNMGWRVVGGDEIDFCGPALGHPTAGPISGC